MAASASMIASLWCPRCNAGPLASISTDRLLRCEACASTYPPVGSIHCLTPDPALWRTVWLNRLAEFVADADAAVTRWREEAEAAQPLPRTRARIARVIAACEEQRSQVELLLADLAPGDRQRLPTRVGTGDNPLLKFYENLFRDWAWGEKESAATRAIVARMVQQPLGRLAAYGVGAGRLAVDVHQTLGPTETWAIDLSPLPLLVADKLLRGEVVVLPEFPVAPHSADDVVCIRKLRASIPLRDGFALAFADALKPPFAPGSLDTVLTSWFIDANGHAFRETASAINRVLRPGGVWLNLGPLRFKRSLADDHTIEEIWDLTQDAGFDLVSKHRDDVPYFDSPMSGSRRTETVFSFSARKASDATAWASQSAEPVWILDPTRPIPMTPNLLAYGRKSVFAGSVVTLIDGKRSLTDVAAEMGRMWGFDTPRILDQLRAFFATLPPGSI
jgi:hypothetical protein